jgi:TRAP transporter TAXI family solute receptor
MRAMSILKSAALGAALLAISGNAQAQILSIGTTAAGAVNQIATTLSKLVSQNTTYQMRSQTLGGTQQYIPMVNAGEITFGLSNLPQYWMAKTGTGLSKEKYDNLMLAANMMTFTVAPLVADASPIRKPADFNGKRVPFGFKAAPLFSYIATGMLANGNLTYKDVKRIPVVGLPQHWDLLKQGKIDFAVAAIGTGAINEMNVAIKGGVRFVSMDNSPEALERLTTVYPKSFLKQVQPAPTLVGVKEPIYTLHYDFLLWTSKSVPDDVVYNVVKAMHANEKTLRESSPLWRSHASATMAKEHDTPYHPGALKFYKEAGLIQ